MRFPAILKLPGLLTGNFDGVCFQYTSYKWYIGQLESIKRALIKTFRSSLQEVFSRKGVLKICNKFTGEHLCRSVISIKLVCSFIEITLRQGCSPVNLLHIFRTLLPENTLDGCFQTFFLGILQNFHTAVTRIFPENSMKSFFKRMQILESNSVTLI